MGVLRSLATPIPIPLDHSFTVPNTDTTIRMGFGDTIRRRSIFSLLVVCEDWIRESVAVHGAGGEIDWDTAQRQMFQYDLGDGIRITAMNLVGKVVHWGDLQTVIQGLKLYLEHRSGMEVMFRFRCGPVGEVGWGWISRVMPRTTMQQ